MSRVTGRVVYRDLEGGTWELHADGGRRYQLAGGAFTAGETVTVEGEVQEGGFGIAMTGLPVLSVRRVLR